MGLCLDHCVHLWIPLRELQIKQSNLGWRGGWKTEADADCFGVGVSMAKPPSFCALALLDLDQGQTRGLSQSPAAVLLPPWVQREAWRQAVREGSVMHVRPPRALTWTWAPSHCISQLSPALLGWQRWGVQLRFTSQLPPLAENPDSFTV